MRKSIFLMTAASLLMTPAMAQENDQQQQPQQEQQQRQQQEQQQNRDQAQTEDFDQQGNRQRLTSGADAEIEDAENMEWVTLNGRVQDVFGDRFVLDYGGGDITVEMDDYDGYSDTFALDEGQRVTVSGRIDDGLFESRTVEAAWIYVDELASYYYADSADEENGYYAFPMATLARDDEWLSVTGTVVSVNGDELTLDVGTENISVDLDGLDREIFADAGDRVSIYGEMDDADLWEGREIVASSVIVLSQG